MSKDQRLIVKLPEVRLSFPNLFKPKKMNIPGAEDRDPEYSANFILDAKKHRKEIAAINDAVNAALEAKFGKVPKKFKHPLRDGADMIDKETDEPKPGYGPGTMFISARNKSRPQVVLRDLSPAEESDVYAGCYVNTQVTFWAWDNPAAGKGVSINLGPVQFVRNGERFGASQIPAEEAFEALPDEDGDDDVI